MNKNYQFWRTMVSHIKIWLFVCAIIGFTQNIKAQVSNYSFAQSTGTYTPITGGTAVVASGTTPASDDVNYPTQNIGFTFNFNGTNYTQFGISSNGYIWFGTGTPSTINYTPISDASANLGGTGILDGVVSALGFNLLKRTSTPTGELRVETAGTAGNQICTIQFSNWRGFALGTSVIYNFQIKLYETSNKIDFVYGAFTMTGATTNTFQIGLRGINNTDFKNVSVNSVNWAGAISGANNTASGTLSTTVFPANGTVFSFNVPVPCNGTPTAGTTSASVSTVCYGGSSVLSLTGATTGTGITYQWQSSPDGIAPYTNIASATSSIYSATNLTSSAFYRCVVTCANPTPTTANSTPVQITVGAPINTFPYVENFNSTAIGNTPTCWSRTLVSGTNNWLVGTTTQATEITSNFDGNFAYKLYNDSEALFISPAFNFASAGASSASLDFQMHRRGTAGTTDKIEFYANTQPNLTGAILLQNYPSLATGTSVATANAAAVAAVAGDGWYNYQMNIPSSLNAQPVVYIIARGVTASGFSSYAIGFDNFRITLPCNGTPTAGTTSASFSTVCAGGSTLLSLTGATAGTGITYQWQSSPDGIAPYVNIASATSSTYSATNLTSSAFYRCVVTCANPTPSSSNSTPVQVVVTTPTYATVPYTQSFESTWLTNCVTAPLGQDAPDASWRMIAGSDPDASWRADNTTTTLSGWTSVNGLWTTFAPAPPLAQDGSRAARFHSYNTSPAGTQGSLDLYINLSTPGTKQLSFWYIAPSTGVDQLEVLLSEDGGNTFAPITTTPTMAPPTTAVGVWTNITASLTSVSATAVIRFRATGDNGSYDIGLDNVAITLPCNGTPTAGTITTPNTNVCAPTTLSLTGGTLGVGISYQWEISTTDALTGFTSVTGAVNATYVAPAPSVNTWYRVVITCANGGATATTTALQLTPFPTSVTTYPYNENFDGVTGLSTNPTPTPTNNPTNGAMPCGWSVENTNGDASTWKNSTGTFANSAPNALAYNYNSTQAANDWAFTPAFTMTAGKAYKVTFKYRAESSTFPERIEVRWGTAANASAMLSTNSIFENLNVNSTTYSDAVCTDITPATTGVYYVGIYAKSLANQFNLYVDNFQVIEACPTIVINPATLPNGVLGTAYSVYIDHQHMGGFTFWQKMHQNTV